jgi:hypothetical protein
MSIASRGGRSSGSRDNASSHGMTEGPAGASPEPPTRITLLSEAVPRAVSSMAFHLLAWVMKADARQLSRMKASFSRFVVGLTMTKMASLFKMPNRETTVSGEFSSITTTRSR